MSRRDRLRRRRWICRAKVRYEAYDDAVHAALRIRASGQKLLYAYECEICSGYHLTSSPPRREAA